MNQRAYIEGYLAKEAGVGQVIMSTIGPLRGLVDTGTEAAKWGADATIKLMALMSLVPPVLGASAGMATSRATSPSKVDAKAQQALLEQQELDRTRAEIGRLSEVQEERKEKRNKEEKKRGVYLG